MASSETRPCNCARCLFRRLAAESVRAIDTAAEKLKLPPTGILLVFYTEGTGAALSSNMSRPAVLELLQVLAEKEAEAQRAELERQAFGTESGVH